MLSPGGKPLTESPRFRLETSKPSAVVDHGTMHDSWSKPLALVLTLVPLLSGCFHAEPPPAETSTSPPMQNACTPYPAPTIDRSDRDTFRGVNAFAFTIGLICDHSAAHPVERARVPGTPAQDQGAAYIADTLRANGFQASFQNFSGEQYEALVQGKKSSAAYQYYSGGFCRPSDLPRLRTLDFANVIGTGGTVGGPIFLLMAHWDSKRFAEGTKEAVLGANDGAAGVGVLLELARIIEADETTMEIRLLLTDGEDGFEDCHPLAGSMYYADRLSDLDRTRLDQGRILLLDMVGDAEVAFYRGCGTDTDLADRIWSAARELDVAQFKDQQGCSVVDDHSPFEEEGLASVDIIAAPFPSYWHTTHDTPDKLDEDMMGDVGRILMRVLDDVSDELPLLH
jgi:hypothetical protein